MALGAKEASLVLSSTCPKFLWLNKSVSSIRFNISEASVKFTLYSNHVGVPLLSSSTKTKPPGFQLHSAFANVGEEKKEEVEKTTDIRRKLFVLNLPWSFSVADIKKLFGECGGVDDVEIIKQKDGKNRGFAFVTMASGAEAQAAILKYDSTEFNGRIIRVEFAKKFKKPIRSAGVESGSSSIRGGESRHKLYVSNLGWKVRSTNLREFFSSNFNPVSVRVVFDSPSGKSAGYGFVSFATKEEADSAISLLDGKALFGRPIRLKSTQQNIIATSETKQEKEEEEWSEKTSESKEEE